MPNLAPNLQSEIPHSSGQAFNLQSFSSARSLQTKGEDKTRPYNLRLSIVDCRFFLLPSTAFPS